MQRQNENLRDSTRYDWNRIEYSTRLYVINAHSVTFKFVSVPQKSHTCVRQPIAASVSCVRPFSDSATRVTTDVHAGAVTTLKTLRDTFNPTDRHFRVPGQQLPRSLAVAPVLAACCRCGSIRWRAAGFSLSRSVSPILPYYLKRHISINFERVFLSSLHMGTVFVGMP